MNLTPARLPINYEAARLAISACERVDECKEWKDRAAAIASYAAQKRDRTLLEKATRIRARATRRLGELLQSDAYTSGKSFAKTAEHHGVHQGEAHTARKVSNVPQEKFEEVVERRSPPMPISGIARLGVMPTGGDQSEMVWKVLDRMNSLMRDFPLRAVVESIAAADPREAHALRQAVTKAVEYFDALADVVERRK